MPLRSILSPIANAIRKKLHPSPPHEHAWVRNEKNSAKRHCSCGAEEWLFEKRYPRIGEPKYTWKRMHEGNRPQ